MAREVGISTLDTAALYGEAEEVIGRQALSQQMRVVTKTPHLSGDGQQRAALIRKALTSSLQKLKRSKVDALLVHRASDLRGDEGRAVWKTLEREKAEGRSEKIGVSVYGGDELEPILDRFRPDVVQLPVSIFDQRSVSDGTLDELAARGIEVHARSVFLQGLVFMAPSTLPEWFSPIKDKLERFHSTVAAANSTPLAAALDFVLSLDTVDFLVIGVEDHQQLGQIIAAVGEEPALATGEFAISDTRFVEPRHWPKNEG